MLRILALAVICAACNDSYAVDVFGPVDGVDPHGVLIAGNGTGIDPEDVGLVVEATWTRWKVAFYREKVDCSPSFDGVYLSFQPDPYPIGNVEYNGDALDLRNDVWGGGYIVMRVVANDNWRTRLGHELGHVTLFLCDLWATESALLWWAANYGVPY